MGSKTKIEWADASWNPIRGCSRVSEGCRNCYAEAVAARFSGKGQPYEGLAVMKSDGPHWTGKVRLIESALELPLHWCKPKRIFVNSMSDLFHEALSREQICAVLEVMGRASHHIFQVLTKRPERMQAILEDISAFGGNPPKHIWWGVSAEDQPTADERIPILLQTPAAVRWVSYEPALAAVDFTKIDYTWQLNETLKRAAANANLPVKENDLGKPGTAWLDVLNGTFFDGWDSGQSGSPGGKPKRLDWVVVGGESGPGARPFDVQWARDVIAQCKAACVPCFVKQLGARPVVRDRILDDLAEDAMYDPRADAADVAAMSAAADVPLKLRDRKGGDPAEWPADLRVRQFPEVADGH